MSARQVTLERATGETQIALTLDLDGAGRAEIDTGLGFLDHMLAQLARHGRFDVALRCRGDLHVDDHHTAEDCALALGQGTEVLADVGGVVHLLQQLRAGQVDGRSGRCVGPAARGYGGREGGHARKHDR